MNKNTNAARPLRGCAAFVRYFKNSEEEMKKVA